MKRLIICNEDCWGTTTPSGHGSMAKLCSAIYPQTPEGIQQVVYWQKRPPQGQEYPADFLPYAIKSAYGFLAQNYVEGDEIWLFGFSQGAYILRSCLGMIRNVGLIKQQNLFLIDKAFEIYRTHWNADAQNARQFRDKYSRAISIHFLGLFETVGTRGIPENGGSSNILSALGFHDQRLSHIVRHGYHGLAINEPATTYSPCIWTTQQERTRTEQCWFAGRHRDIGGFGRNSTLALPPLMWMRDRAVAAGLVVENSKLLSPIDGNIASNHKTQRFAPLSQQRTLCASNHDETLHSTAEQRFLQDASYRPGNLKRYLARDEQIRLPL